jgi:hypothetical protein
MTWLAPFHHPVVWLSEGLTLKNFVTLSRIYESRGIIIGYPRDFLFPFGETFLL